MLWNDTNPGMTLRARESERAAAALGLAIQSYGVHDLVTFDPAFEAIVSAGGAAVLTLVSTSMRMMCSLPSLSGLYAISLPSVGLSGEGRYACHQQREDHGETELAITATAAASKTCFSRFVIRLRHRRRLA
jgi:hypothetical protein